MAKMFCYSHVLLSTLDIQFLIYLILYFEANQ